MKVFKVMHRLNKRELNKFRLFMNSAYFNQRTDVMLLFEEWMTTKGKRQLPEIYWQKFFPSETFSSSKWHLLTSRLFKLLEEFLAHEEMRKRAADKKFYLAKAYRAQQDKQLFEKTVSETHRILDQLEFRNMDYLQSMHALAFEKYDYITSINRKEKSNLQEVSDLFDTYFISTKLRQACYALSREIINQETYDLKLVEEVIHEVERDAAYLEIPAISMYYYCYKVISTSDNEEYFIKLRAAIRNFQQYFPPVEMRDIYTIAINYSIRKLNTGELLFVREAFELYLLSLEQGFLVENGIMIDSTYINLVALACKQQKYQWAIDFITEHQENLKADSQIPLFHFCLGKIYYERGQPEDSLQQLSKVDAKASYIFLGARVLQLKIYYELDEIDPLESLLESLRVYLQRSKDLGYRKAHYSNILTFTRLLLQLSAMSKTEKAAFRKRVEEAETFGEREWFLKAIG